MVQATKNASDRSNSPVEAKWPISVYENGESATAVCCTNGRVVRGSMEHNRRGLHQEIFSGFFLGNDEELLIGRHPTYGPRFLVNLVQETITQDPVSEDSGVSEIDE